MLKSNACLYIIVDWNGVERIQILGDPQDHLAGQDFYTTIQDLIVTLDEAIRRRWLDNRNKINAKANGH
jgi:hypothetical protein